MESVFCVKFCINFGRSTLFFQKEAILGIAHTSSSLAFRCWLRLYIVDKLQTITFASWEAEVYKVQVPCVEVERVNKRNLKHSPAAQFL